MLIKTFVDSEIWSPAKDIPFKGTLKSQTEKARKVRGDCGRFPEEELGNLRTYATLQQTETSHVLALTAHKIRVKDVFPIVKPLILVERLKKSFSASEDAYVWDFSRSSSLISFNNVVKLKNGRSKCCPKSC